MKKNLLLIIVMALVVVNIIMTAVMMISMLGTNKKSAKIIADIATVLSLEIDPSGEEEGEEVVSMADQKMWNLDGNMTIPLKSDDGKNHYIQFTISFTMNSKAEGYKTYGENITDYEQVAKDKISQIVSKHTFEECTEDFDSIREEILLGVRGMFEDSKLIHGIAISGIMYQ